jgi:site-specific DNA recombinase
MIEDSAKKQFQYVLVYQLDRFARNRYDSATYKAKLKKNGVRVLSALENITEDASGILMESILEGMAEYYSAELAQKIRRGMDINAQKCLTTGGNVALGFKVDSEKRFQIDTETAPIVQQIFEMYAQGENMASIIRYLNNAHVRTSRNNEYNKNSIYRILTNKRYIGIYTYRDGEIPNGVPRIVSDELFNKVKAMLEKNRKAPARSRAKAEYILTTKLFCGRCDSMMTGITGTSHSGKKYYYYICVQGRKRLCGRKTVQKDYIEDLVVKETKKVLTDESINRVAKEVVALCEKESNSPTMLRLKKLLKENGKATEHLLKALETGQAADIITERLIQKKVERADLEKQLAAEKIQYPVVTVSQVKFSLAQFKGGRVNDLKYRKALINTFVRKVILYDDKMTILFNIQDGQISLPVEIEGFSKALLVEAGGVEPPSEGPTVRLSPGAERVFKPFPSIHPRAQGHTCGSFIVPSSAQSFAEAVPLVNDTLAPAIRVPPAGHYTALSSVS